eukprot:Ihof_evm1s401 gene=Ihof_evmTU1s401
MAAVAADFRFRVSDSISNFFSGTSGNAKSTPLRDLLESGREKDTLDAMKRTVSIMSKGQDVSNLFPHVVKLVVSPSMEVKKLAYIYLVRYAEEQPDIALLSINSFQKDLKGPNPFIRASALRVMSSIRVEVIVPLIMLAVKETISDMSPYVRKVTAHAIPKIYSIDATQKDCLIEVIEKLLDDRTVLVLGSAIMAFEEVCPNEISLLHKHFRKLCSLVVDMDEWGQIACINLLTRYARSQFLDPTDPDGQDGGYNDRPFYSDSETEEEDDQKVQTLKRPPMDPDHRLMLTAVKPLLQSRNSGVVFAVAKMFYYCAPSIETQTVGRTLVGLAYTRRELAYVVLSNIETMSAKRPEMFAQEANSFFIKNDMTCSALLKIHILANIAMETNVSAIMRELLMCVRGGRKELASAAIEAMGRCAANAHDVISSTITTLMTLISNTNEEVVGSSIVVIKRLLQIQPDDSKAVVRRLARMFLKNKISVPLARASVLWLIGENTNHVSRLASDILRVSAQTFAQALDIEKVQIMNLGAKLVLTNARRTLKLMDYILTLAKYDVNYDIRDKGRMLRVLLFSETSPLLKEKALELLTSSKPVPKWVDPNLSRGVYTLGSLSHVLNTSLVGYQPLSDFPLVAPDPKPRQVDFTPYNDAPNLSNRMGGFELFPKAQPTISKSTKGFYSSTDSGSESQTETDESSFYSDSDDASVSKYRPGSIRSRSRSLSSYSSRSSYESRSRSSSRSPSSPRLRSRSPARSRSPSVKERSDYTSDESDSPSDTE